MRYRVLPNVVEETRRLDDEREKDGGWPVGMSRALGGYINEEGEGEVCSDGDVRIEFADGESYFFHASTVEVVS